MGRRPVPQRGSGWRPNVREADVIATTSGETPRVTPGERTSTTTIVVSLIVAVLISFYPAGAIAGLILAGLATAVVMLRPDLRHQWRMRIICAAGLLVPVISLAAWIL